MSGLLLPLFQVGYYLGVFAGLVGAIYLLNLPKENRSHQFLMPYVAIGYCLLFMLIADQINALVSMIPWFNLPLLVGMNFLLLFLFIPIKTLCLLLLRKFKKNSSVFYEYVESLNHWVLRENMIPIRDYLRGFYIALLLITAVILILYVPFSQHSFYTLSIYPAVGILILGEIILFLSGLTKKKFIEDILGEDPAAYDIVNYVGLRTKLRTLFGDRLLYENTTNEAAKRKSNSDTIVQLRASLDSNTQRVGEYFQQLHQQGQSLDTNYIYSALQLTQGKSVIFYNPFYRDLGHYIFYPMFLQLLNHKKCLILTGRHDPEQELIPWVSDHLYRISQLPSLWKVALLKDNDTDIEVGILPLSEIYNTRMIMKQSSFFNQVEFVLILEPSRILATAQVGLSMIINRLEAPGKNVTYASCDRNCDGLVDALSHILKTSITEVAASELPMSNYSHMYWHADGDFLHHRMMPHISRYLGVGSELMVTAMKYQVPNSEWFSSDKFPVIDMKWIVGQYMNSVSQYVNIPVDQETLNTNIQFTPHLWDAQISDYRFLVVEDEYRNLFEMTRNFATRARAQGFINVISESYLLREYMLDHPDLFINDRKAIPTIVPDYARTERNTVLKLMMLLLASPIPEQNVLNELRFLPAFEEDPFVLLPQVIAKHIQLENVPMAVVYKEEYDVDGMSFVMNKYLKLELTPEIRKYMVNLRNAYYIAEDEVGGRYYVGAKLYGHVYQTFLPGQFFTFSGKYYEVISISETIGVVVRRAADHIARRRYYKQIQTLAISNWEESLESASVRTMDEIFIQRGFGNVEIATHGYLEMANHGDLKTAQIVKIKDIPSRMYKYKQLLRIQLPDCPLPVRYTLCTLLNEMFKTYYPDTYNYIQTCTSVSPQWIEENIAQESSAGYLLNTLLLDQEDDSLYLIEDSELDLGLIVSIDRNLRRFFETMTDLLQWYLSKQVSLEENPKDSAGPSEPKEPAETTEPSEDEEAGPPEGADPSDDIAPSGFDDSTEPVEFVKPPDDEFIHEDGELRKESSNHPKYLNFGFSEVPKTVQLQHTLEYLSRFGFQHNYLQQARANCDLAQEVERTYQPQLAGEHYCDFCAAQLSTMQFEVLQDGRERCLECSQTAIKSTEEFKQIFQWVRRNMEAFFNIKIQTSIKVRTTNAKKISRIMGKVFIPTPGYDHVNRILGLAVPDRNGHSIYLEIGAPRLSIISVIAHELVHIWQFLHWDYNVIRETYGEREIYITEGMAMWAEIQFMILMNEVAFAKREEMVTRLRDDEYGIGFREMVKHYPLQYSTRLRGATPFQKIPPI